MKPAIAESFFIQLQAFKPATAQGTKEGPHNRNRSFIVGTPHMGGGGGGRI